MIPHTYPTFNDARGAAYMEVFFLPSVTGLTRWVDYIPVKTVAFSVANEGTTNAGGHMTVVQVASSTALQRWVDYIPVFEDAAATIPWDSGSSGYIPVCQALMLDFMFPVLDSRITFTRADATSCATYFGNDGLLKTAAANVARFDYDPATPVGTVGGELVTNGNFSSGSTGWTPTGAVAFTGGYANFSAANQQILSTAFTPTVGKTYKITFDVANSTAGLYLNVYIGSAASFGIAAGVSNGTKTVFLRALSSVSLVIQNDAGSTGVCSVSNISVQEVTFAPRGLLIEEQRTNLLLHSRDMTQAAWSKTDVTPTRNQVGIDGTANSACLMTEGSAGTAFTQQTATITAGSTVAVSEVVKRGNTDWVWFGLVDNARANGYAVWYNLATGAAGSSSAIGSGTLTSSSITNLGGGFYRLSVVGTVGGVSTTAGSYIQSATANGSSTRVNGATYIVDCAQLEVGSFATSIITTGAATVTRAADSASMTGTNFSSWFNASAGTFVADSSGGALSGRVFTVSDGSITNQIFSAINGTNGAQNIYTSGAFVAQQGSLAAGAKTAGAYSTNDFAVSVAGGAVSTDTSGALAASYTRLDIGQSWNATVQYNGWLRRLTYYPTRLANATLQALTL